MPAFAPPEPDLSNTDWARPPAADYRGRPLLGICLFLYGISFLLPYESGVLGAHLFLLGLVYCWLVPFSIPWWANVVFAIGLIHLGRRDFGKASLYGMGAFLLTILFPLPWSQLPEGPAYWSWAGSMAVLALGGSALCIPPNALTIGGESPTERET